ncbi:hypothetical protein [Corynebacterium sp.]|uniref:hypothetical protein n=1 Tax=Corynebacterium sp. TaxID=1720 RepID=UPI0026DCC098|nr:hypothetical protein [Corynebacterium sp.]MDO5032601.1 hypothetical protein [Corynebacterium sp.]
MNTARSITLLSSLVVLAVALVVGVKLAASYVAVGTFLFATALMLGPFAGVVLCGSAVVARSPLSKSLFAVGGILLVSAIVSIGALPFSEATAVLPLFIGGTIIGALGVLSQRIHWHHGQATF